jgi:hypothetical protein
VASPDTDCETVLICEISQSFKDNSATFENQIARLAELHRECRIDQIA